jgi:hypothetical protein
VRPGGGLGQLRNCHGEHRFDESDPAFCDIHYLNLARRAPPRFQNSLVLTVALARTALAVAGLHETSRGIASADPNSRRAAFGVFSRDKSSIFAFSAEKSKILRMFADFVRPKGTGEAQFLPAAADSCAILSVENRAGALLHRRLLKTHSPRHRVSRTTRVEDQGDD